MKKSDLPAGMYYLTIANEAYYDKHETRPGVYPGLVTVEPFLLGRGHADSVALIEMEGRLRLERHRGGTDPMASGIFLPDEHF